MILVFPTFDALELGELTSSVNNEYDDVELSDYDVKDIEDMKTVPLQSTRFSHVSNNREVEKNMF